MYNQCITAAEILLGAIKSMQQGINLVAVWKFVALMLLL
jgi:hypothetical protein